jgi:MATE family multidrug resistance protein
MQPTDQPDADCSAAQSPANDDLEQPGSLRELLRVSLPLMISSGSLSLMHIVDRIYLSHWSVEALAASAPAGIMYWTLFSLPFGIAVYTNTFVAQYFGSRRPERVVASVWQGLWLALAGGLLLAAVAPFSESIFRLAGHEADVLRLEAPYFSILCIGAAPALLSAALSAFFSGRGRTLIVMWVNVFVSLMNVGLDYVMVFGLGPIPEMGIRGAAWATNIASTTSCLLFLALMAWEARQEGYPLWTCRRFDPGLLARFLRYGASAGVQNFVDVAAFMLFVILIGRIGTHELAATNIAFNLNSMAFIPMFGMGTALMTLVGRRIGERRPDLAVRTTRYAFNISAVYMLVFAALYLGLPDVMLIPYGGAGNAESFEQVRPIVVTLLKFVAAYSFFDAMAIIYGSAIRGAGDTTFSLWWTCSTGWLLMVLPAFVVYYALESPAHRLIGCWSAATFYIVVVGIGFALRFRGGKWQAMSVIERYADDAPEEPAAAQRETEAACPAVAGETC